MVTVFATVARRAQLLREGIPRAHAILYTDAETTYSGAPHPVTDPLGLRVGARLEHELFPQVTR
jgi:hypothetical protein